MNIAEVQLVQLLHNYIARLHCDLVIATNYTCLQLTVFSKINCVQAS